VVPDIIEAGSRVVWVMYDSEATLDTRAGTLEIYVRRYDTTVRERCEREGE
jgi:hypothetical protein